MRSAYERAVLDIGTGDGRFVLRTAASRPETLVVGLDANAAAMAEASRRAARKPSRGGPANALFIVAAAESLPCDLDGAFDEVSVHFPWGSLLRGVATGDTTIVEGLSRMLKPCGRLQFLFSITEREAGAGLAQLDEARIECLGSIYAGHGLQLVEAGLASDVQIDQSHSTWAKRLGREREVWRLVFGSVG